MSDNNGSPSTTVRVRVPARGDYLHVVRTVVAGVAALQDFRYEEVDDLRMAVDEACSNLMAAGSAPELILTIESLGQGGIQVLAAVADGPAVWPREGSRQTLSWQILSALVDEAAFERSDDGVAIRFTKVHAAH